MVRFAAQRRVPIVPFGAGSGVCGGILPSEDAIVLDLKRMSRVRTLDVAGQRLEVEAGALGLPLEQELERNGATLGHFPSSILCSTVGGWVVTRSAGQASGQYGKIEDMVVAVEAVTGAGDIVQLARRRVGPDLSALVVGSEGALAVVTSSTLRIHPAPRERAFGAFSFRDVATGIEAMRRIYQAGLRPAVCRLYDPFDASLARSGRVKRRGRGPHRAPWWRDAAMRAAIARSGALNAIVHGALAGQMLGGALLVLVWERHERGEATGELLHAKRLVAPLATRDEGEGPARRWLAHRYSVSFRQSPAIRSGLFIDTFEIAAPWSKLEGAYDAIRDALGRSAFVMAHFSHAYPDGCCIYFTIAGTGSPADNSRFEPTSASRYDAAWRDGLEAAVDAGATVAHHHGVGRSKARGMAREVAGAIPALRALKRAFDPYGILNPGVLAPLEDVEPSPLVHHDKSIDERSQIAWIDGDTVLRDAARALDARGLALVGNVEPTSERMADWLARGAAGSPDPFVDPVDHVVAGIEVALPHGRVIVPPVPRRATGPDFGALAVGAEHAFGAEVAGAWLRVAPKDTPPRRVTFAWDDRSPLNASERALTSAVARELAIG